MQISVVADSDVCREAFEVQNADSTSHRKSSYLGLPGYQAWQYHEQSQPMKSGNTTADPAENLRMLF